MASRCISRSAMPRTDTAAIIGRFRQFRPARISRATTPASTAGNERSTTAASPAGTRAEIRQAMRPSSHKAASSPSGAPLTGGRPVQLGSAVSRNPAIVAMTKPNSISWMCQASGSKRLGRLPPDAKTTIHTSSAAADHIPPARKNGRKPWARKTEVACLALVRSARRIYRFAVPPLQAGHAQP